MRKEISEQRKGEAIIALEAFLWGFFPIITVLSFVSLPILVALGWSTVFACLFFLMVLIFKNKWHEMRSPLLWKYVLGITAINGIAFYVLYFTALKYTTPGNAAIISLLEILTSYVFFNLILSENISREYILGACLMLFGAGIVLAPNFSGVNIGDILMVGTALIAPIGNMFQQRARKVASGETIVFLRSLLAAPSIFVLAYLFGQHATWNDIQGSLFFLVINGAVLLGFSKLLWVEGIHRMSVTKAMALQGAAPFITLVFAWLLLNQAPTAWQLFSLAPLFAGVLLLTNQLKFRNKNVLRSS